MPARLDRLPWARFHSLVVAALGITWILDGLEVTLAGSVAATLKQGDTLALSNTDVGLASSAYVAGAVLGALFFGWLTDRLGRRRLFFITLGRLHGRGGGDRPLLESRQLRPLPLPHRGRHRRRICGDQLHDPGADPLPLSRLDRSRHQRQLLGRRGAGGRRLAAASGSPPLRRRSRLAPLLPDRRRAVAGHLRHAALAAGIAPLAPDPWPGRGGAARHRRHRAPLRGLGRAVAGGQAGADPLPGPPHRPRRGDPQPVLGASPPGPGGAQPDGRPGLLLQRDLLHLRPRADGFLRRPGGQRRLVHPALRRRQFPGSPAAGALLRHGGPQAHDRRHLYPLRPAAGASAAISSSRASSAPPARRSPG